MTRTSLILIAAMSLPFASAITAGPVEFQSAPSKTHLLELFTSEGCSSCPPAEAWLSGLKDDARLWRDFVPVAFHVDYWDNLGWRDPYASKAWTARQYQYASHWKSGSVYTPGFVLDGEEWSSRTALTKATETPGVLKINVASTEDVTGSFAPAKADNVTLELHVARLGFSLTTDVKAGENSGRKLRHDFVVLALGSAKMVDGKVEVHLSAGSAPVRSDSRGAVVAWVTALGASEPIQAVGGWTR